MTQERVNAEKAEKIIKPEKKARSMARADGTGPEGRLNTLQKAVGNRAVQRLLVQQKGDGSGEVDDDFAERINRERDSGQALDSGVAESVGNSLGADLSDVRVHTSPEAADLSDSLSAKAFTTGRDIFFEEGAYSPATSGGQELLAHELTHVVQQGTGAVGGAGKMTVNAPGDAFEQQADAVARADLSAQPAKGGGVQRQEVPEEEETAPGVQRIDDEEHLLMKRDEAKAVQRVEQEDQEEKLLLKPKATPYIQRIDDEEKIQKQELPEEKKEEEEET